MHKQLLYLHTWKAVVGRAVVGPCQVAYETCHESVKQSVVTTPCILKG